MRLVPELKWKVANRTTEQTSAVQYVNADSKPLEYERMSESYTTTDFAPASVRQHTLIERLTNTDVSESRVSEDELEDPIKR